jgi:decaprenylphospho-beta-D-erythro-pentofuranosid-2-ulose 2-reductase
MKGEPVLILGAGGGIARALANRLAEQGYALLLAGRNEEDLARTAADCRVRHGVEASVLRFDALDFDAHDDLFAEAGPELAGVLLCYGDMPSEEAARDDVTRLRRMIDVNYTSAVSILELAARQMSDRGRGWIAALSSVAGDRGRPGNYLYGSTKGALSCYLQGLRARMAGQGIKVVDVRPGVVDTGMTFGLEGLPLMAPPDRIARDALRGIERDRPVVYTPWFWAIIMLIIRLLPDRVFNKLEL